MQQRLIGPRSVSSIGLGGMPMSIEGRPDAERSISTIHAALDAGVTVIDSADAYHRGAGEVGHNEELVARALRSYGGDTSGVLVATKGGHLRPGDGSWTLNGHPDHLKAAAKGSAQRLGLDAIGLYQFHRPDPKVPYAESIGAIRDLLDEGVIELAGISNANVEQIDLANDVSAAGSFRCRTSSRRRSGQVGVNSSTVPSSALRSCPGRRSAASGVPPRSAPAALPSSASLRILGSVCSR